MARRISISRNSVRKYLALLATDGESLPNTSLADKAYNNDLLEHDAQRPKEVSEHFSSSRPELSKTGMMCRLLWREYIVQHPDGYSYSRYCHHLQQRLKNADLSMHLEYQPGDMMMIDFAGKKQSYVETQTCGQIECQVFAAVLPYSGLIFCQAVHSQ